jgi:hypothetical protein
MTDLAAHPALLATDLATTLSATTTCHTFSSGCLNEHKIQVDGSGKSSKVISMEYFEETIIIYPTPAVGSRLASGETRSVSFSGSAGRAVHAV